MRLKDFIIKLWEECPIQMTEMEIYVYPDFLVPEQKWEILVPTEPNPNYSKIKINLSKNAPSTHGEQIV